MKNVNYSLSYQLGEKLAAKNYMVAVAESCTGGGLAVEITAVSGSSKWFDRGFVTYSNAGKIELLDVDPKIIEQHGAVSEQTAIAMAKGVLAHSEADIAISITGIAGPGGGTPEKPVGTVWFGLAQRQGKAQAKQAMFTGGRKNIRTCAVEFSLQWLINELG